jgi:hypothetical protein
MHAILDYYEANRNTTRFPVLINYEDNVNAIENAMVVLRLQKLGYRVHHLRYRVTESMHDSRHGGFLGEVFAELTQSGEDRARSLKQNSFLLPLHFSQVRKACAKYHLAHSYLILNTTEGNATGNQFLDSLKDMNDTLDIEILDESGNPSAYYCSIFITKNRELLSISRSFTVYV